MSLLTYGLEIDPAQFVILQEGKVYRKSVSSEEAKNICFMATYYASFYESLVNVIEKNISDFIKNHPLVSFEKAYFTKERDELVRLQSDLKKYQVLLRRWKIVASLYC